MTKRYTVNQGLRQHAEIYVAITISILAGCCGFVQSAYAENISNAPKVLIINSYHPGYPFSDEEVTGIKETLQKNYPDIRIIIEYLYQKHFIGDVYLKKLEELFVSKYRGYGLSLVITTDNPALDFILKHRNEIFSDIPLIFCGVNNYSPSMIKGHQRVTGVEEVLDVKNTVKSMLQLHPDAREIYIIHDYLESGIASRDEAKTSFIDLKGRVKFRYAENLEMKELLDSIRQLRSDTLVLILSYSRDKSGNVYTHADLARLISNNSSVPVYAVHEARLGHGIVGGSLLSGIEHGSRAAKMAVKVLSGDDISRMPVYRKPTSKLMFDYYQLMLNNISLKLLPPDSEVVNRPQSFYEVNKEALWISVIIFSVLIILFVFLAIDIIKRKRIEKDLSNEITVRKQKEQERIRLTTAIEQSAELIMIMDADGTVQYVNPATTDSMGYNANEIIGKNIFKTAEELTSNLHEKVLAAVNAGDVWTGTWPQKKKDGETCILEVTLSPICDDSGALANLLSVSRDVTKETALEKQLRQSQKMEAVGTLAGGIAHDFNNILAIIIGYAELGLEDTQKDDPLHNDIKGIHLAANRAKELVQQILTFSRKQEHEKRPVNIVPIIKEALKFLRSTLPMTIEIKQNIAMSSGIVSADPTQIHQVLMNLCTNAAHSMEDKGGILEVSLMLTQLDSADIDEFSAMKPGHYLKLSVSDTGDGIDKENLARIFDPYFTTKEIGKGTGMGLSVVLGIIKSHEGDIKVYSEPGKGTVFTVFLPLAEEADKKNEIEESASVPTGTEHILFVDDESGLTDVGTKLLEKLGYRMTAKTSPVEALEAFQSQPDQFDLVITDKTMPNMTGYELTKALKQIRSDIPVIMCTGFSEKEESMKAEEMGISAFVMKPISKKDIAETIRNVLDNKA